MKVLYGVSSIGLGHARRSLSISRAIREFVSGIEIDWLCAEPVLTFLRKSGEQPLELSSKLESISSAMESVTENGKVKDMSRVARLSAKIGRKNYQLIRQILPYYDILIQDEFVETLFSFMWDKLPPLPSKRVVITDYVRFETNSINPLNRIILSYANRSLKKALLNQSVRIFADELDSLPHNKSIRAWVSENFHIIGPVIDDIPSKSGNQLKQELFHLDNDRRLVVFTVGGTSIGRMLFEFVSQNVDKISSKLDAQLAFLPGPRHQLSIPIQTTSNLVIVPFTVDSMNYFKAADCIVTQAGASTLNEIACLGKPCVCIPILNHWEQRQNAERFATRCKFEKLEYQDLSVENLVQAVYDAMSRSYEPVNNTNGSKVAAGLISSLIGDEFPTEREFQDSFTKEDRRTQIN